MISELNCDSLDSHVAGGRGWGLAGVHEGRWTGGRGQRDSAARRAGRAVGGREVGPTIVTKWLLFVAGSNFSRNEK